MTLDTQEKRWRAVLEGKTLVNGNVTCKIVDGNLKFFESGIAFCISDDHQALKYSAWEIYTEPMRLEFEAKARDAGFTVAEGYYPHAYVLIPREFGDSKLGGKRFKCVLTEIVEE